VAHLAAAGFGLGILLAAQIGPVTLLVVRSVLRGGRAVLVGLAMAAAVTTADVLYAVVGLAGAGRLLDAHGVQLGLGLVSGLVLVVIGTRTVWTGLRARLGAETIEDVLSPRAAFATAFAATALNPLTIALWTIAFPAAAPQSATTSVADGAVLLAGVVLGTLTWYCGLSTLVALVRHRVGPRLLDVVDVVTGGALVAYGALLGYRTLRDS
jgi:putative LysE/RhtB family amino acid efflux pump